MESVGTPRSGENLTPLRSSFTQMNLGEAALVLRPPETLDRILTRLGEQA